MYCTLGQLKAVAKYSELARVPRTRNLGTTSNLTPESTQTCKFPDTLLEKFERISLYVTDDAFAKLYICDEKFSRIEGNCRKLSRKELNKKQ